MKLISKLLFIPVAAAFVVFAVANRHEVTLNLWPLPLEIDLPVYIALLGALAVGMAIGGFAQWVSDGKWRRRARAGRRKASALERELTLVEAAREAGHEAEAETAGTPPPRRPRLPGCGSDRAARRGIRRDGAGQDLRRQHAGHPRRRGRRRCRGRGAGVFSALAAQRLRR